MRYNDSNDSQIDELQKNGMLPDQAGVGMIINDWQRRLQIHRGDDARGKVKYAATETLILTR